MNINYTIQKLYNKGLSQKEVAQKLGLSYQQVIYRMEKFNIPRRSHSEATYRKRNPSGDPFKLRKNLTKDDLFLKGLGLGLYWGEGTKSNKNAVRLGNTDPILVKEFIRFLIRIFGIRKAKLRFGLQIFSDINQKKALSFWINRLKADKKQFQKIVVTSSRGSGTYKKKIQYGVLTVYYCNKKLRDVLINMLE